ncbi:MAG TPA: NosD domain-containing protein, partial [Anaerolineales bacterium]|nr:NosD domain-containing protein [Anaerolineales bacterium]
MRNKLITILLVLMLLVACQSSPNEPNANIVSVEPAIQPEEDNSSEPSGPDNLFEITGDHMVFQQGNNTPNFLLVTETSQFLPDNNIGAWTGTYELYENSDFFYKNGFKRIRIGGLFDPNKQVPPIRLNTLSPEVDETITEYAENGIKLILTTPRGAGLPFPPDFENQEQIDTYLEYLDFVTSHFKGRIQYYEILNEPLYMSVEKYAEMLERSVEVIREVDPDAKIIMGAVSGGWLNDYPGYGEYQRSILNFGYLFGLIQTVNFEEVQVEGYSWHPLYDNIPSDPYYQHYPEIVRSFQEFASSRRFEGEFFADEILWVGIDEKNWDNGPPTDPAIAAKYQTRAITEHRALGVNVTINTFWQAPFMAPIRNLNNVLAGAEPVDIPLSLETSEEFDHLRAYGFTLTNGDLLLALWTNDIAVEEDPGVNFTLTIRNFSADTSTGIDVYYGFEQELVSENVNKDLVIQNLMVKDYPNIIKFSNSSPIEVGTQTEMHLPQEKVILVENTSDSGPGSFRQALTNAKSGDKIAFDPDVFDPEDPATISIKSGLPEIGQGFLIIDASNAGVILDGSGSGAAGLAITSEWNTIQGLHIINFSRPGIIVWENAGFNTIGGDPQTGLGPLGQGNLISGNNYGIALVETRFNTITGNQIGVEFENIKGNNRQAGIYVEGKTIGNTFGPNNIIVNNGIGIDIQSAEAQGTTITRNLIYRNEVGIRVDGSNTLTPNAPVILLVDLPGTVSGTT